MEKFNLSFSKFIGKNVILSEPGEYYCGEYIQGRLYRGIFGGCFEEKDGFYFKVRDSMIKIGINTEITFEE